ncbi:Protein TSS like [Quillaja saponaria]|uniref:Protein TSS like n=1 Tax=Quillaja saponaria TaxID=32244 RepID=A0AAD7L5Q7_QUISA|nr:Protein TSS like [Quillaja saponaria]
MKNLVEKSRMILSERAFQNRRNQSWQGKYCFSFIVKSVQKNVEPVDEPKVSKEKLESLENSSDPISKDSAIIKILYGNEGKTEMVSQSSSSQEQEKVDVNKKNGDVEGFVVVTKRRRNRRQFTNGSNRVIQSEINLCFSPLNRVKSTNLQGIIFFLPHLSISVSVFLLLILR